MFEEFRGLVIFLSELYKDGKVLLNLHYSEVRSVVATKFAIVLGLMLAYSIQSVICQTKDQPFSFPAPGYALFHL